jgi:non-ribosomal peptide synthetase component F
MAGMASAVLSGLDILGPLLRSPTTKANKGLAANPIGTVRPAFGEERRALENSRLNVMSAGPSPMPMGELLAHHARKDPARPAVTYSGATVSYADLDARSNRKARQLAGLGVAEGDVVTLAVPNGLEYYETVFAVWKLGATPTTCLRNCLQRNCGRSSSSPSPG